MSWMRVLRSVEADARRRELYVANGRKVSEREAVRNLRELERQHRAYEKAAAAERALTEAATFENYLTLIVSLHKDCSDPWKWHTLVETPPPERPTRLSAREQTALRARDGYKPGLAQRIFGDAKRERSRLDQAVTTAKNADDGAYQQAVSKFEMGYTLWQTRKSLGARIVAAERTAYREALDHAGAFEELDSYDTKVSVTAVEDDAIALHCEITDPEIVPTEEVKLTAGRKLTTKTMAVGRYWDLYQDHVCSCALRVARETLAVLPITRAVVSVGTKKLDTSTGHQRLVTLITVMCSREVLQSLNFSAIDPSDAMTNFPHRMKFKKSSGFEPVEPIALDEGWVSAG
jgi:hypothetical protein